MILNLKNKSHTYEALKFECSAEGVESLRAFCPHFVYFSKVRHPVASGIATLRYYLIDPSNKFGCITTNLREGMYLVKVDGKFVIDNMFTILIEDEIKELENVEDQDIIISAETAAEKTHKALSIWTEKARTDLKLIMEKISEAADSGRKSVNIDITTSYFVINKLKSLGYSVTYIDNKRTPCTLEIYW